MIKHLEQPVEIYSLVIIRIAFGLVMFWEVLRYLENNWIEHYWIKPKFNFAYPYFEWLSPLTGDGMIYLFYVLGVLALCIALGLFYRFSTILFFVLFSYVFLLEEAQYLNHFYFVVLISFLLIFLPCNRAWSFDVLFKRVSETNYVPVWTIYLLRFQVGVIYFFGGIAKLNRDWLRAEPMGSWLASRTDFPLLGQWMDTKWMAYSISYSGLFLDLLAVPFLLYRKTRVVTFFLLVLFHFSNDRMFNIGIFPWMSILATTIFFSPDWSKQLFTTLKQGNKKAALILMGATLLGITGLLFHESFSVIPLLASCVAGALLVWQIQDLSDRPNYTHTIKGSILNFKLHHVQILLLSVWVVTQSIIPLRHYVIPSYVHWTEEGHRFAWHMKLRSKSGIANFTVIDKDTGAISEIDTEEWLRSWQYKKMSTNPYMIWQFSRFLEKEFAKEGKDNIEIRVDAQVSLNGRSRQAIVPEDVDLLSTRMTFFNTWILPHNEISNQKRQKRLNLIIDRLN